MSPEAWDDPSRLISEETEAQGGRVGLELSLTVLLPQISEEVCLRRGEGREPRGGGEQAQTLQGAERGMGGWG